MAIRDGRIVAVGTNADIVKLAGAGTRAGRSRRQDGAAGTDRFPRACAERVDVRVRAAGSGHGERRGRARVHPGARRGDGARAMDHAVAGVHHAAARAALSDARRARSGGAPASRRLPHRTGRVAELDGAVDERHRREVPGARRRALPRRARRERRADGHSAQLRSLHPVRSRAGPRRPTPIDSPGCESCWPTTTRSASPASSTPMPIRAASSCTARCSSRTRSRAARSWPTASTPRRRSTGSRRRFARPRRIRCTSTTTCCGCAASRRSWTAAC